MFNHNVASKVILASVKVEAMKCNLFEAGDTVEDVRALDSLVRYSSATFECLSKY